MKIGPIGPAPPLAAAPPPAPPLPSSAVITGAIPTGPPDEVLGRLMAEMVEGADRDVSIRSNRIRQRARDAARARVRVLEELRRQARARRKARRLSGFKKFLAGVAAVVGAAAAIVAASFTGGGSAAAYVGAVLGITAAASGAASAGTGMAAGQKDARAAMASLRSDEAGRSITENLEALGMASDEALEIIEHVASMKDRAASVIAREQRLAHTALGSRTW